MTLAERKQRPREHSEYVLRLAAMDDVAKRGATLEDLAWMENIYSPPIGALFEPIQIAAQAGLAEQTVHQPEREQVTA